MQILRLQPIFQSTVWGGTALVDFAYKEAPKQAGECWGISAHPHGDCLIANGEYKGRTLSWCYANHRELFGNLKDAVFPLLVKVIGAEKDLSIQVHPDDAYAMEREHGSLGKTECWYILDCKKDASIVIGHHARNKMELQEYIEEGHFRELIRELPIQPGDFFHIEPGCLHAIKGGTLLLETQQSSDVTYRVYDYDRLSNGKKRTLHTKESIDCICTPHVDYPLQPETIGLSGAMITTYVSCPYFTVQKWSIEGEFWTHNCHPFINVSVIEGAGTCNEEEIKKGDHLIITSQTESVLLTGSMVLIVSFVR